MSLGEIIENIILATVIGGVLAVAIKLLKVKVGGK